MFELPGGSLKVRSRRSASVGGGRALRQRDESADQMPGDGKSAVGVFGDDALDVALLLEVHGVECLGLLLRGKVGVVDDLLAL